MMRPESVAETNQEGLGYGFVIYHGFYPLSAMLYKCFKI